MKRIILGLALLLFIFCLPSSGISETKNWSVKMQGLSKTLADLLTDVSSDQRFQDPKNRVRIQTEADQLAALTHDLGKKGMVAPDSDPTIQIMESLMDREAKRAALELKRGHREYARSLLRAIPSYCIACHTRNATGPQFSKSEMEPSVNGLSAFDLGEFFTTTRQFDRALEQFKKVTENKSPKSSERFDWTTALNWSRAVQESLAIAVRVKQDPIRTKEIVNLVLSTEGAPAFMKQDAKQWKASVEEWENELARQIKTEEGFHTEALRLMAKAKEVQKYPADRSADILYLRAVAAVHDLLQAAPKGAHVDEAFLLAGLSYEVLSPVRMEELPEIYYEACVRRSPSSQTGELCYQHYEETVFANYTGSAGTRIPEDVKTKLFELRMLLRPEPAIQK